MKTARAVANITSMYRPIRVIRPVAGDAAASRRRGRHVFAFRPADSSAIGHARRYDAPFTSMIVPVVNSAPADARNAAA